MTHRHMHTDKCDGFLTIPGIIFCIFMLHSKLGTCSQLALLWQNSTQSLQSRAKGDENFSNDDDELMLNVLRCHLTY